MRREGLPLRHYGKRKIATFVTCLQVVAMDFRPVSRRIGFLITLSPVAIEEELPDVTFDSSVGAIDQLTKGLLLRP
jgi:hypothetical protein